MYLIPKPNGEFKRKNGTVGKVAQGVIACKDDVRDLTLLLEDRLAPLGGLKVNVTLLEEPLPKAEEYYLEAAEAGVTIRYGDRAGASNALVSLYQLLRQADTLPCLSVHDWPKCTRRGQSFDSCRHFFTIDEMKKTIEQLALLKCNVLHWVCVNDQAWRIEIDAYPKLTEANGQQKYSKEEVRDLIAYAAQRNMQIVPEFEIPGHESAALSAYPDLTCRGNKITPPTVGGIFPVIMCAGKEGTYTFMKTVIAELVDLFPAEEFHLGGDEAPKDEWKLCPHCQAKMKELGMKDEEELQAHLMNYAAALLRPYGKTLICWNESVKLGPGYLDKDIVVQYWMDQGGYCKDEAAAGRKFILSNFKPLYLDYPCSMYSLKAVYEYEPHIKGIKTLPEAQIYGYESCIWAEHIATIDRLEYMLFPRVVAAMELFWTKDRDYKEFAPRASNYVSFLWKDNVNTRTVEEANIHGWQKVKDLAHYSRYMMGYGRKSLAAVKKIKEESKGL